MPLTLQRPDLLLSSHYIDGHWCEAVGGSRYDIEDPAREQAFASVPDADARDAQAAVDAAHAALPAWRALPARDRSRILARWNTLLLEHRQDLGRLISREQGKPLAEAVGEVLYAASYVEWFAAEAVRAYGEVIPAPVDGRRMTAVREPVGVVAAITPWNFPAAMIARKIAPALAAGCTLVAKPAEDTPLTALALVALAEEAGVPAGVLNLVTASRANAAAVVDVWLRDMRVRKLTFTGSTPVGQHLARESATTLKKLSLELGGNAPFLVFEDADLDAAADGLMAAKFRNAGQTCVCPNRILVHEAVHDAFVERLVARVSALRVGPASDPQAQLGPLINRRAVEKVERHVRDAVAKGARIMAGGSPLPALGANFFQPTVLVDVDGRMELSCEETFGPVAAVSRFADEAQAVAEANATPYGLAAYFYTRDVRRIARLSAALEAGMIGINEGAISSEAAPFGGIKASGYGREGSRHGLDEYMHSKYLCQGELGPGQD
ncbi:NAD-dependent succinate-semialdehyde dehydrogenase [Pseudoxanthomonas koreensis]|uniref:NAD-dependent succinate-semialdehyde dehydrogenase n=1 Tax=Pseudoxanthomonas koreensis TaxID=266061 RepID=UPI001391B8E6|nr:NAD-dependent succinate-semialdehyde dehydrogenase [Pseudoxanthomonas koreensis]KAF1690754.1 succinate-semialdehyde dehydrogenase (NADP(+)) [Pseudoxanthomonas koreensis]